jgi:predicted nucleotidyltransferase
MKFGLKTEDIEKINNVFKQYPKLSKAILYGSRAKGNFKKGSDIDLTFDGKDLNLAIINKISLALDDLLLPYTFDLSILEQIKDQELLNHIKRIGVIFYEKIN